MALFHILHIPFAFELPIKINITGDPKKDATYLLIGIAACVALLIITIATLVIVAFRKKNKVNKAQTQSEPKVKANKTKAKNKETSKTPEPKQEIEPITDAPKEVEKTPIAEEKEPILEEEPKVQEAPKTESTPKIEIKEEVMEPTAPEDKMEEIRKRLAEIAQNRKSNPSEYQEIHLPKISSDIAKTVTKDEVGAHADTFEAHETEEIPNDAETFQTSVSQEYDYQRELNDLDTDFKGNPVSDSDYSIQNEESLKNEIENNTDSTFAKQEFDTDFSGNPVSDSVYSITNEEHIKTNIENAIDSTLAKQELETDFSGEPVSDSHFSTETPTNSIKQKINPQFQNSNLPVKRMTFTEWMDSFKS